MFSTITFHVLVASLSVWGTLLSQTCKSDADNHFALQLLLIVFASSDVFLLIMHMLAAAVLVAVLGNRAGSRQVCLTLGSLTIIGGLATGHFKSAACLLVSAICSMLLHRTPRWGFARLVRAQVCMLRACAFAAPTSLCLLVCKHVFHIPSWKLFA